MQQEQTSWLTANAPTHNPAPRGHGEPHVELDDVRLLVVTGGVAGELEDLDHPRCWHETLRGRAKVEPP